MKKDNFFKETFILVISNLTTGILGFIFSLILSQKLGAEGLGLYGLIMPMYNLIIAFVCGGMIAAISKIGASYNAKGDTRNLHKTVHVSLVFDAIWALFIVILFYFFTKPIAYNILKDPRAETPLKIVCIPIFIIALSNIFKGYFFGTNRSHIPALIDILEKGLRVVFISIITNYILIKDVKTGVNITYITLLIGESFSFLMLYIFYKFYKNKDGISNHREENRAQLIFDVVVISLPLCLNGVLSTAIYTMSTVIVPRRLVHLGMSYANALSLIGKFNGMALNIALFPAIVVGSLCTVLIPDISKNKTNKDYYSIEKRVKSVFRICLILGLCSLCICTTIPNELGTTFYKRNDLSFFIAFGSITAPTTFLSIASFSILNGLGKQNVMLRNSLISSLLELLCLYVLIGIPTINILGYGLTELIVSSITFILNLYEIEKEIPLTFSPLEIGKLIFSSILSFVIVKFFSFFKITSNLKLFLIIFLTFFINFFMYSIFKHENN